MSRVLMCGCRDWTDVESVYDAFDILGPGPHVVIQGGAPGADAIADRIAIERGHERVEFRADWDKHGRAAGPIRNQAMIEIGHPTLVFAFWDGSSKGTLDMIKRSVKAGLIVRICPRKDQP